MNSSVKEHYDKHLGSFYSWMLGDFETHVSSQIEFFRSHDIIAHDHNIALDLGCGNGIQSVSLARLGFNVFAFDFNTQLLDELKSNIKGCKVIPVHSDLMDFDKHAEAHPDVIVCMGDTITHLSEKSDIKALFGNCNKILNNDGVLVLSFRDMSNPLEGVNRFIPVKSDDTRILTCFLEYFDRFVTVHDLLHEKVNGAWIQKVSSYNKIRISEDEMEQLLKESGFTITSIETINRMVYITAKK
jgi:2-polyprenyl-3-methyl-5-hydroxy-6-metoxy-1,4-benzoquinol methylase